MKRSARLGFLFVFLQKISAFCNPIHASTIAEKYPSPKSRSVPPRPKISLALFSKVGEIQSVCRSSSVEDHPKCLRSIQCKRISQNLPLSVASWTTLKSLSPWTSTPTVRRIRLQTMKPSPQIIMIATHDSTTCWVSMR
jgi:hypothetical protein